MPYLVYFDKCPECKNGEIVRLLFSRYGYCSENCGILLHIPSWRESEKKVSAVCWQVGDEPLQKMTWEHYEMLSVVINIAAARIGKKYPRLIDAFNVQ